MPLGQCYKNVCALLERQMRKSKPDKRLNVLYAISAVLRLSKEKHGSHSKYGKHHCKPHGTCHARL